MKKVVFKILQGSVVTQTTLGGLTVHPPVANFLWCICAKNNGNWMTVDKVIAKIIWLTFFGPPCIVVGLSLLPLLHLDSSLPCLLPVIVMYLFVFITDKCVM